MKLVKHNSTRQFKGRKGHRIEPLPRVPVFFDPETELHWEGDAIVRQLGGVLCGVAACKVQFHLERHTEWRRISVARLLKMGVVA